MCTTNGIDDAYQEAVCSSLLSETSTAILHLNVLREETAIAAASTFLRGKILFGKSMVPSS